MGTPSVSCQPTGTACEGVLRDDIIPQIVSLTTDLGPHFMTDGLTFELNPTPNDFTTGDVLVYGPMNATTLHVEILPPYEPE